MSTVLSEGQIQIERDGAVGIVRINRPERLNAFVGDMRDLLLSGLEDLEQDPDVRAVIITGIGRAFSTGGDVTVMSELVQSGDIERFERLVRTGADIVRRIESMTKPVIAAVNGPAAGAGACLALACDIRIAAETASIGFTFARVGLHPDWGGSYFLTHLVGPALATELILTGGMVSAERAERLGLVNRVVPASALESTAREFAGQLASAPAGVVADAKQAVRRAVTASLGEILEFETEAQLRAFQSPDAKEGFTAFLQKRAPRFGRH